MGEMPPLVDPADDCPWLPARELFRQLGYEPLPPGAVDDFQLRGRLWEFIYALAGRRFWLCQTNHLGDRQLYTWLHDVWLGEQVADIPPEAGWNCHVDAASDEIYCGRFPVTWLRFYANEKDRADWARDFPKDEMPPSEPPPCDRDRWLPEPFYPPTVSDFDEDAFPFDDDFAREDHRHEDDPLGLEAVDAAIQANQRREHTRGDEDDGTAEYGERVTAMNGGESEGWRRPIDTLRRIVSLPPPAELTDETLHAKLWELLHNLACQGSYVLSTNHLSDRELYARFWSQALRQEDLPSGKIRTSGSFHDCVGSGSDEDIDLWLRFHADDRQRADWERQFPRDPLPPKEKPPFNRDWRLPKWLC